MTHRLTITINLETPDGYGPAPESETVRNKLQSDSAILGECLTLAARAILDKGATVSIPDEGTGWGPEILTHYPHH